MYIEAEGMKRKIGHSALMNFLTFQCFSRDDDDDDDGIHQSGEKEKKVPTFGFYELNHALIM